MAPSIFIDEKKRPESTKPRLDNITPAGKMMVDLIAALSKRDPVGHREQFKAILLLNPKSETITRLALEKNNDIIGLMHLEKVKSELAKILPSTYGEQ